jgi:hypothetical protein
VKKNQNASFGHYKNSHTVIKFTRNATANSPSLRAYLTQNPDIKMILSKFQVVDMERGNLQMSEFFHDFRWKRFDGDAREHYALSVDLSNARNKRTGARD